MDSPLPTHVLRPLLVLSDAPGLRRLAVHGLLLAFGVILVLATRGGGWVVPAMALLGVVEVALFAPLHETTHRTPFRSRALTRGVALFAGFVLILPPRYFRCFHMAHHRHVQDERRDPELVGTPPLSGWQYVWRLSGVPYWIAAVRQLVRTANGSFDAPWLTPQARGPVTREARAYLVAYLVLALGATIGGTLLPLWLWVGPVILGQPVLRYVLLAEHAGCALTDDAYRNTRTTLASWPIRYLFWNASYHAEHHLVPGVPFHALPRLHRELAGRLQRVSRGYAQAHREIRASLAD